MYLVFFVVQSRLALPLPAQVQNVLAVVFISLTLLAVLYMLYRAWSIRGVLQRGSDVQGKVTSVEFRRVGGKVGYSYSFGQKRLTSEASLRLSAHTRALRKGERVLVVVDHDNPRKAFIRDLYR